VQESADYDPEREPWYAPELHWRALMSGVDRAGGQFIWFVGTERAGESGGTNGRRQRAVFFTVVTQDPLGVRDASGSLQATADHAPPRRREGALHYIVGDGSAPGVVLLEAPFDMACAALREALTLNWVAGEAAPLGYRLFAPLIWLANEAAEFAALARAPLSPEAAPDPDLSLNESELVAGLDHPAFWGWFSEAQGRSLGLGEVASYARRFASMSRWLAVAGEGGPAQIAATLAYHLENQTPEASSILAAAILAKAGDSGQEQQDQSKESRDV
jgi:hypothetical protein